MDWNKAKNITLASFLLLNLGLFLIIIVTKTNYSLTNNQQTNIVQVLSKKYNITIYKELPKKYEPLQELELINEINTVADLLLKNFLDDDGQVNQLEEDGRVIYQGESRTVVVQNGSFTLTSSEGIKSSPEEIIKSLGNNFDDFYLFSKNIVSNNEIKYEYRQKFKGQTIYTNFMEITETDIGVTMVDGYYAKPLNFTGEKNEIISVDRALFTLAQSIPRNNGKVTIIEDILIVYNQDEITSEPLAVLKATPCYLISVQGGVTPYKIDAYTNTLIN